MLNKNNIEVLYVLGTELIRICSFSSVYIKRITVKGKNIVIETLVHT